MRQVVTIGILHSSSGPYAGPAAVARAAILRGAAEVNAQQGRRIAFRTVARDPAGRLDRYAPLCREMLVQGVRHVFGCITSSSRKEVIPELQRHGGLLWYSASHEGFEASEHVAYTHSCPNQHLLPLLDWALERFGGRVCLVGADYIWGWEIARIARERVAAAGGQVLSDRFWPVGQAGIAPLAEAVRALRPDFILNSLIGDDSYAFLAQLGADRPPVLSANFTEAEIAAAGPACEGLWAAGPWFEPGARQGGSIAEMSRRAVHQLADLLQLAPEGADLPLGALLARAEAAGQPSCLDPHTQHARQPVIIAQIREGRFRPLLRLPPRAADPFLTRSGASAARPLLRALP